VVWPGWLRRGAAARAVLCRVSAAGWCWPVWLACALAVRCGVCTCDMGVERADSLCSVGLCFVGGFGGGCRLVVLEVAVGCGRSMGCVTCPLETFEDAACGSFESG
jgi:hypothetical protein